MFLSKCNLFCKLVNVIFRGQGLDSMWTWVVNCSTENSLISAIKISFFFPKKVCWRDVKNKFFFSFLFPTRHTWKHWICWLQIYHQQFNNRSFCRAKLPNKDKDLLLCPSKRNIFVFFDCWVGQNKKFCQWCLGRSVYYGFNPYRHRSHCLDVCPSPCKRLKKRNCFLWHFGKS